MFIRRLVFVFALFAFFSCKQTTELIPSKISFSITSPKTGWTYYEDSAIMLAVNVDTHDIVWNSSLCGYVGKGNHITAFLPEGIHRVSAEIQGVTSERIIRINPAPGNTGQAKKVLINYVPMEIKLKSGNHYPYIFTQEGTVTEFKAVNKTGLLDNRRDMLHGRIAIDADKTMPRDMRLPLPGIGAVRVRRDSALNRLQRNAPQPVLPLGYRRNFFVVNTSSQMGAAHEIEGELYYQSGKLTVWLPVSGTLHYEAIDNCIQTVENIIIPRIEIIWGSPADIDGDGRFALLFAPSINDEKLAVGFFNPADFFARDDTSSSDAYNPASNEMDILYIALPELTPGSSYSPESIIATIAHELTHAVTFTQKTWTRIQNGNDRAKREELFLDEGWSHLAENLCGYGVSGGNIRFMNRYFDDTSLYSLCGANRYGQEDSAGMRGAVSLFLSWLFWKAGGMRWDNDNSIALIDEGGIAFLQRMAALPDTGWESIGKAFGKPVGVLFNQMIDEINGYRITGRVYQYRTDPLTNEAVDFFVNMGTVRDKHTNTVAVGFPKQVPVFSPTTLTRWAMVFVEPFAVPDVAFDTVQAVAINGDVFFAVSPQFIHY